MRACERRATLCRRRHHSIPLFESGVNVRDGRASNADMIRVDERTPYSPKRIPIFWSNPFFHWATMMECTQVKRIPHRKLQNFYFISKWLRLICKSNAPQQMSGCVGAGARRRRARRQQTMWIRRWHVHVWCATYNLSAYIKIMFNCDEHKSGGCACSISFHFILSASFVGY